MNVDVTAAWAPWDYYYQGEATPADRWAEETNTDELVLSSGCASLARTSGGCGAVNSQLV